MAKYVSAGLCCYELGQLTVAAAHQRRALEIAVRCNYRDVYLRSVEYLGLTIQRSGDFQQAISVWETKLKFVKKTEVKNFLSFLCERAICVYMLFLFVPREGG